MALIGFAGVPFTVASYAIEGGPSRTFAKVKALMHGDPELWHRLTDRLAAMAVASLRAQIEAGAQAVQLSTAGPARSRPSEYARFALPATRAVLAGIADLGVPTILFGVGTGELLALMASAGTDVVGVDWRVPLTRRAGAWAWVARCRGTSTRPSAWRRGLSSPKPAGPFWRRPPTAPAPATSSTWVTASSPNRIPASWPPSSSWSTQKRPVMTTGILLMAHGTPAARARSPPSTRASGAAAHRRRTNWQTSKRATPPSAASHHWRSARRHRSMPCAPSSTVRAPDRYIVSFGAKHTEPLIEESAALLGTAGLERVIGLVLTPHGSSLGSQEYLDRAEVALGTTPFVPVAPWYAHPSLVALLARRVQDAGRAVSGRTKVIFTAHSLPERIRETGDTYPEQLAESARLVATAAGLDEWIVAWQSGDGPPTPGSVPTCATSCGNWQPTDWSTPSSCVRSGS